MDTQVGNAAPAARIPWGRASAWIVYDLANTVYAATLTFLFTPYFAEHFGQRGYLGITQTVSMVLAGLMVPALGALADRTGRSRGYLVVSTLACVGAMALWSLGTSMAAMLACLFLANISYQTALTFYNTLLPSVTPDSRAGLVNGIGVGVGYFGTILVTYLFLIAWPAADLDEQRTRFWMTAALFLLFALPCMLWVRDRRDLPPKTNQGSVMLDSLRGLRQTLRELPRHRALMFFLIGNFFLVDVLNTAILFFADFTGSVFAEKLAAGKLAFLGHTYLPKDGMGPFLGHMGLMLNTLALVFGVTLGFVTDRAPLRVMRFSGVCLGLGLVGGAVFGGGSTTGYALTLIVCGALGLAGIWTAGRKIIVQLAPRDRIGEYFGLYGITVKISVIGSTVFGLVADSAGPKAAILAQGVQLVLGLTFLYLVRLPSSRGETV